MVVQFKVLFYHRLSTINKCHEATKAESNTKKSNDHKNILLIKMKMISQNVT